MIYKYEPYFLETINTRDMVQATSVSALYHLTEILLYRKIVINPLNACFIVSMTGTMELGGGL